jgi:hypothetical protein
MSEYVTYYDPPYVETTVPSLPTATSSHADDLASITNILPPVKGYRAPDVLRAYKYRSVYGGLARAAPTLSMYPWLTHATAERAMKDNYFPRAYGGHAGELNDSLSKRYLPQIAGWDFPIERDMANSAYYSSGVRDDDLGNIAPIQPRLDLHGTRFNVHPDYNDPFDPNSHQKDIRPSLKRKELVNTLKPAIGKRIVATERIGRNKAAVDHVEKKIGKRRGSHTILGIRRMTPMRNYFTERAKNYAEEKRYQSAKADRKSLRTFQKLTGYSP